MEEGGFLQEEEGLGMRTSEAAEGKVGGLPRYGGEVSTEAKENF